MLMEAIMYWRNHTGSVWPCGQMPSVWADKAQIHRALAFLHFITCQEPFKKTMKAFINHEMLHVPSLLLVPWAISGDPDLYPGPRNTCSVAQVLRCNLSKPFNEQ